jgi:serine/threonine protein phosphatase PrpC
MARHYEFRDCGSTVAAALIRPSISRAGKRDLYVANVGDARAVLAETLDEAEEGKEQMDFASANASARSRAATRRSGQAQQPLRAVRLTRDHVPRTPGEIGRVVRDGGRVWNGRVMGQLAVSRALGDHALKSQGVSADPHVLHVPLSERHKFLILGCDGVWDVVSDAEAVSAVKDVHDPKEMARKLVKLAIEKGSTDNVSVMAIRLHK